jgi:hypothetical protein
MGPKESAGSGSGSGSDVDSVVVLSPQQFHDRLVTALRAAMAARAREPGNLEDEGTRMLFGLLQEVPSCVPREPSPPLTPQLLVNGVRYLIDRRRAEAATGSEQLLVDLRDSVLVFYPEAIPPPGPDGGSALSRSS